MLKKKFAAAEKNGGCGFVVDKKTALVLSLPGAEGRLVISKYCLLLNSLIFLVCSQDPNHQYLLLSEFF